MSFSHQTARLSAGRHASPEDGVCVMELASVLGGQPFSDRPWSVSPMLLSLLRGYNDGLDDRRRQALRPFAATTLGTAGNAVAELERSALLRAFIGARHPGRTPWTVLLRHHRAGAPYTFAYGIARKVVAEDDEPLHGGMLELVDALIAVGRSRSRAGLRDVTPT